jgi:transposase
MRSRAYGAIGVKQVDGHRFGRNHDGQDLFIGLDIGKYDMKAVARWSDGSFERPWQVQNPTEIHVLIGLLTQLRPERRLLVGMEPSGTYGDALRQALHDADIAVARISPKISHDYAEVFDGVPSQHDGKDAALIAELTAMGKGKNWTYEPPDGWEQELCYWVERMECHCRIYMMALGALEALLGRHWPEATRVLQVSSATLLRVLETYGGPAALAADPLAGSRVARWGGTKLKADKVQKLLASARDTVGVRAGDWDTRRIQDHAQRARAARREIACCKRHLQALAKGHPVLGAQGKAVGLVTACVLWVSVGDPRDYFCARAYRKALGLNLVERSSGIYQGKLRISKRGSSQARQWLYLATLRLVKQAGVRPWYEAKKARDGRGARRAVVAVMRKLGLALYHVGARGAEFSPRRLFARIVARKSRPQQEPKTV